MKDFYTKSYWFWVVSKIILAVILLISTFTILGGSLRTEETLANILGLIEGFILLITLFHDFSSNGKLGILKIVSGSLMTLFGVALFIVLLTVAKDSRSEAYLLGYPMAIWMILVGIFDILRVPRPIGKTDDPNGPPKQF